MRTVKDLINDSFLKKKNRILIQGFVWKTTQA